MSWSEFSNLVSGLLPDTPLGQIVTIRSTKDKDTIKKFTPQQKKIYNEWKLRIANKKLENKNSLDKQMKDFEDIFAKMFGSKK